MLRALLVLFYLLFTQIAMASVIDGVALEVNFNELMPSKQPKVDILNTQLQNDLIALSEQRSLLTTVNSRNGYDYQPENYRLKFDNNRILKRTLDRSVSRFLKSSYFKKTSLGKTAEAVKKNTQTNISFKDEKNIEHKFRFKFQAFRGLASLQYSGLTNARLIYSFSRDNFTVSLDHPLGPASAISIQSTLERGRANQYLSLSHWW